MYGLGCCCRQLVKYVSTFSVVVAAGMSDCTTLRRPELHSRRHLLKELVRKLLS